MIAAGPRPGLLASVATPEEMALAIAGGADIVDLKDPAAGALGAWELDALERAVKHRAGAARPLLSATVGDHPCTADALSQAAEAVAATGIPLVKIGFATKGLTSAAVVAAISGLAPLARRARLVAVLFADQDPDFALLGPLTAAGFHGAMLDTADKAGGALRHHLADARLGAFVAEARGRGLLTGLAGSLRTTDIAPLAALAPDYLGFRGALCSGGRIGRMEAAALADVRARLDRAARLPDAV
ncbi:(5-formylfuran-3-yl)methyl phosphate synthase [Aquabacter spiritensis]|uniref:(5-formylfuran-3-yl)methyl phosphate synthase n=1 Tax=Aquabacter spiritensis TaxID=933073 RepID=A0A4R3LVV6_9HYPH|nr:(5-formylfuran-3-yl)methyl phosphate synthase [Aquabacter spiritensis]TCT02607.1 uncharacterized protein (UPF0264 family) [Aquabacter spiritensis]